MAWKPKKAGEKSSKWNTEECEKPEKSMPGEKAMTKCMEAGYHEAKPRQPNHPCWEAEDEGEKGE